MRFSFTNPMPCVGFALNHGREGDTAVVDASRFVSSEDGILLVSRLEAISSTLFAGRDVGLRESQIENLLAVYHADGRVDVVINELSFLAKVRPKRSLAAGEEVRTHDILDIEAVEAVGHQIPDDAGFVILVSIGWQKGLFYDFQPFHKGYVCVERNIPRLLAQIFAYLMFRDRLVISDTEWVALTSQRWFPFASLSHDLLTQMLNHARAGWSIDDLLPKIVEHVRGQLPEIRGYVEHNVVFDRHRTVIRQALDAYERREFAIVVQALFSRVEGLLREHVALPKPGYKDLAQSVAVAGSRHQLSLMMPSRFRDYVTETLFAWESFDNPTQVSRVTRHSVSHGVASDTLFDEKSATLAVLIFQHLGYLFANPAQQTAVPTAVVAESQAS